MAAFALGELIVTAALLARAVIASPLVNKTDCRPFDPVTYETVSEMCER